jgi:protein-tyrosine phosphatase
VSDRGGLVGGAGEAPAEALPGRAIRALPNLRDVGGLATRDGGRVRRGLLFRSEDLGALDAADLEGLVALGLRTVFDLRTEAERAARPDRLPTGVGAVALDVLRDSNRLTPAHMGSILADPGRAEAVFGEGRAATFFVDAYREFVHLGSAREGFGRLFAELLVDARRPALVHCTTGKDRTGWAVAALLLMLGVPEAQVREEYHRSGPILEASFAPLLEDFAARGGDPALLRPLVGVDDAYLDAALDEVRGTYGSIEGYFATGLGIDGERQEALRVVFVGPG